MNWQAIFNTHKMMRWLTTGGIRVLLILLGAWIITRIAAAATRRIEKAFDDGDPTTMNEREKKAATVGKVARNTIRVIVWGAAGLMVLREFGVDIAPILAGVGIVGLAVGFGAQSLVKDFLAGIFILTENQFNVGDVIKTAGVSGLVERITLRATTLRDLEGRVHIVPNGSMGVVTNMTREWARCVIDVNVAYKENLDRVMDVLREIGDGLKTDPEFAPSMTEPLQILGVESLGESGVTIRVVFKTRPEQQWAVAREFRRRVKSVFDREGIEIPFPQRTVHIERGRQDVQEDPRRR
jgi:small-conductance mechanosensitive channel